MPDFGGRWINRGSLAPGGQAQTFLVADAEHPDDPQRVAKILNNPKDERKARFLQEIEVTEGFDHPNVVRSIARGETTRRGWPFFIMPFYSRRTLEENYEQLGTPLDRLKLFLAICEGVAYAHCKHLIHRDLKPANIFMAEDGSPVVGDFGLCYRADEDREGRNTQTAEAVGARKYMPPEWREGRADAPQPTGDIYSLGKILYWMFAGRVYDGHEDDHISEHPIVWVRPILVEQDYPPTWIFANTLANELVGRTVRKNARERVETVEKLIGQVKSAIDRIESRGRVLDFNLPKRCLFCAAGIYRLAPGLANLLPVRENRKIPATTSLEVRFGDLQEAVKRQLGFGGLKVNGPIPVSLVCDFCGNVQFFRLDLTKDGSGQNWNP